MYFMRKGNNPNIHKKINMHSASHRVIIPVYIPNSEGYFKGSFEVFKICIQSLLQTINTDTKISIISNASSEEVNNYISELWKSNKIDRAIFISDNVGKMNAIIAETRASFEEFITYSDSDVFFDKGWLLQTYQMFKNVPKAGFVSMNPTPGNISHADSTVIANLRHFLFNKKSTKCVCSYDDLKHFHESVGRDIQFTDNMYDSGNVVCIKNNYIIGARHFCCTIRKTPLLKYVPSYKSNIKVSGSSENKYLDIPFDKTGLWRLSSPKAYVWHMGNGLDKEWALKKIEEINGFNEESFSFNSIPFSNGVFLSKLLPYKLKVITVKILKKLKVIS